MNQAYQTPSIRTSRQNVSPTCAPPAAYRASTWAICHHAHKADQQAR